MLIDHTGPTITNCIFEDNLSEQSYYYSASGGAIFIDAGNPAIVDCVFRSNHAEYNGGAIYSKNFSSPSISTCVFEDNTALKGGAICNSSSSTADISGCLFSENVAEYFGGAIYLLEYCTITLSKCSMLSNAAGYFGAGVYSQGGTMTAIGCTFNQNSVSGVDGWGGGGGIGMNGEGVGGNTTVSGNEFKDNTAPDGGGILNESGALSVGTTLFCGNNTGDIGGGWTDLGGNGFYGVCDQGACCTNDTCVPIDQKTCLYVGGEYQGLYVACADAACPISCFGDVTEDGVVDVSDVLGVIGAWGACP
jgi:predicted outer membrane repeat protein